MGSFASMVRTTEYIYELGFQLNRYGYASAVAIIGAILVFIINYAVHRLVRPVNDGSAT